MGLKYISICLLSSVSFISYSQQQKLLIRCDDIGISHGVNVALKELIDNGIPVSASIIVPGGWFPEAVAILKDAPGHVAVGIHLTANSEWDNVKWRPLIGYKNATTLVDSLGYFKPGYIGNWLVEPSIEQLESEFRAQIDMTLKAGLKPTYLDGHMGVEYPSQIKQLIEKLGEAYNLKITRHFGETDVWLSKNHDEFTISLDKNKTIPATAAQKILLLVTHLGNNNDDMKAFLTNSEEALKVAAERNQEREYIIDPAFAQFLEKEDITLVNYKDLQ